MNYFGTLVFVTLATLLNLDAFAHHTQPGVPYYSACMGVGSNGADQAPKIKFIGTNGSTNFLVMDNTGPHDRNDFEANQPTCVEFSTRQAQMSDVGPILALEFDASHMTDDLDYNYVHVWRMQDGEVMRGSNGHHQFSSFPNTGTFGDDGIAVKSAYMQTTTTGLVYITKPEEGRWIRTGSSRQSQAFELERTLTSDSGQSLTKESKSVLTSAIESKLEFEGIGDLTSKLETSLEQTKTSQTSSSEGKTVTTKQTCTKAFEQVGRPIIWQWENSIVANSFSVTVRTCDFACTADRTPPNGVAGDLAPANSCDIK